MDDVKKQKYIQLALNSAITLIFIVLSLVIANFHEHWSDEAQSFFRNFLLHKIRRYTCTMGYNSKNIYTITVVHMKVFTYYQLYFHPLE